MDPDYVATEPEGTKCDQCGGTGMVSRCDRCGHLVCGCCGWTTCRCCSTRTCCDCQAETEQRCGQCGWELTLPDDEDD
jgi:hypothetical protein